ncbi:MAG: methyltransferase domain-containing protein [Acidimicrobiales bacterium]|nr:methyltransferase domain-containing protein [Acidimicrobiales bacterium]
MTTAGQWDPTQYNRFAAEREQPFHDLVALLEPVTGAEVVDLGCGDGRLTALLHQRLSARHTVGIDSSPEMLARTTAHAGPDVEFEAGDLSEWRGVNVDVVLANASLHWVPDHEAVLRRYRDALAPDGQLAVQVPANPDHPSHEVSRILAEEWFGADAPRDPVADHVLRPETYAELLATLGFARQHVRLQVYGHRLARTSDVVEWVKGTSLTRFARVLPPEDYDRFVAEYRRRLMDVLGDREDYFYAFKRILFWGRLG